MSLVWKLKYEHVYKISAKKMFGDTQGVIRSHRSKKGRQCNDLTQKTYSTIQTYSNFVDKIQTLTVHDIPGCYSNISLSQYTIYAKHVESLRTELFKIYFCL